MATNLLNDVLLLKLCRDDGQTCVTEQGEILSANPCSVNFSGILEYVQRLPIMTGKEPVITRVSLDCVEKLLEEHTQNVEIKQKNDDSSLAAQLLALCQKAVELDASDIHIEIYREKTKILVRVDGRREVLTELASGKSALHLDRDTGITLATYIFSTLGNTDIHIHDPANDSFNINLSWNGHTKNFEFRSALIPIYRGLKVTLRSLTPRDKPRRLCDMNLLPSYEQELKNAMKRRSGAILVTGPMGSGKSSLVWAMLDLLDSTARCIHALEDPVEFEQEGIAKTLVEPTKETKTGSGIYRDYAYYAKEQLRHDIDVTFFGELRGKATSSEFAWKATTGGLAIATLHTNSAPGVPQTLIENMHLSPATVASPDFLNLLIHTKLVRRLCPHCSLTFAQASEIDEYISLTDQVKKLLPSSYQNVRFKNIQHQNDCKYCSGKGEKGRVSVMEMIVVTDVDREFILNKNFLGWKKHLKEIGWVSIQDHVLSRIAKGEVDINSASEQIDNLISTPPEEIYKQIREELEL